MNEPLEILGNLDLGLPSDWKRLRTALEAQAEELAGLERSEAEARHYAARNNAALKKANARIARLERAAKNVTECLASQVPVYLEELEESLNESPTQSAAHLKAEALRGFRQTVLSNMTGEGVVSKLDDAIDRAEREANTVVYPYYEAKEES